jgi:hypothetical protein
MSAAQEMSVPITKTRFARTGAFTLAAMLVVSACGASESDTSGDRDRNVQTVGYGNSETGIAISRLGQQSQTITGSLSTVMQTDGSSLVMAHAMKFDESGWTNEFVISRITAVGLFDGLFGANGNGVVRIPVSLEIRANSAKLTPNGHVLIARYSDGYKLGDLTDPVGLTRYNAQSGEVDRSFGVDGFLAISNLSLFDITEDASGRVTTIDPRFDENEGLVGYTVRRFTSTGPDTNFGQNGSVLLDVVGTPGGWQDGDSLYGSMPRLLWIDGDTLRVAIVLIHERSQVGTIGDSVFERGLHLVSWGLNSDGAFDESRGDAGIRVTRVRELSDVNGQPWVEFADSLTHSGPTRDGSSYLTVSGNGSSYLWRIDDDFSRVTTSGRPDVGMLPRFTFGSTGGFDSLKGVGVIVAPNSGPVVVAIRGDAGTSSTQFIAGMFQQFEGVFASASLAIGDYPYIGHDISSIGFVNDDVFINLESGRGLMQKESVAQGVLSHHSGYLRLGTDGQTVKPFGDENGMAPSPLSGVPEPLGIFSNALYPIVDGGMYAIGAEFRMLDDNGNPIARPTAYNLANGAMADGVAVVVRRFTDDGAQDGKTIAINVGGFTPLNMGDYGRHAFDGRDAFYVFGMFGEERAVAKVLVSKRALDTSWGTNGISVLPNSRFDDATPVSVWVSWRNALVQVQPDGSVDVTTMRMVPEEAINGVAPNYARSVRIDPRGRIDTNAPAIELSTNDDETMTCECIERGVDVSEVLQVVVDPVGRMLAAYLSFAELPADASMDVAGLPVLVRATIKRFNRDGTLDPTFGSQGRVDVPVYQITGGGLLVGSTRVAVHPDGRIFGAIVADVYYSTTSGVTFGGPAVHSMMFDTNGKPLRFEPRQPDPVLERVAAIVAPPAAEAPTGVAGNTDQAVAPIPAPSPSMPEPIAAVISPPGLPTSVVVPADVIQMTTSPRPVITVVGSPADRSIEVRWAVPESIKNAQATYTVTASPGGKTCTTATTSCTFKKLDPWTSYTFAIRTVSAASTAVPDSTPSIPIKPIRVLPRRTTTDVTKLITPASMGKQTWKVTGSCKLSGDKRKLITSTDAALCTLSLTTAKSGKTPKTTRSITIVVKAVAN